MLSGTFKLHSWLLACLIALTTLLTGCDLPQVSAEQRVFLPLSLEWLDAYPIQTQEFQGTTVGGLSAITYDRARNRLYALSDDRSEFAPARFYTLNLALDSTDISAPKIKQATIEAVTTITDETGQPYTQGTIDPEGIALSPLGTVFISSEGVASQEIPPFVREFDLKTGQWKRSLIVPQRYIPAFEAEQQTQGVGDNLGFESLTLSPGGTAIEPFRLFTATESALVQDADADHPQQGASRNRVLHYIVEADRSLLISEHLYPMAAVPEGAKFHGLTELLAIDQGGHFLSLERSFGTQGFQVKLFQIAMGSATDTSRIDSFKGSSNIEPVQKKLLLDLNQLGIRLDNLEGMTLGPRLPDGSQSLILVSDNNFNALQITQLLLFRLKGLG
ncbi:esterase-like activity of phytase family protein [Pantanalinema rosaneae CENA516]|uniref:esterase-like activity of phytase family protein n=1 Tax=Pantanalinema rosaneae TaxID=1620701 RepID=UPI003D6DD00A